MIPAPDPPGTATDRRPADEAESVDEVESQDQRDEKPVRGDVLSVPVIQVEKGQHEQGCLEAQKHDRQDAPPAPQVGIGRTDLQHLHPNAPAIGLELKQPGGRGRGRYGAAGTQLHGLSISAVAIVPVMPTLSSLAPESFSPFARELQASGPRTATHSGASFRGMLLG